MAFGSLVHDSFGCTVSGIYTVYKYIYILYIYMYIHVSSSQKWFMIVSIVSYWFGHGFTSFAE